MSQRRKVERIKDASERTIEGLVTKDNEFVYEYTGGRVPKDKTYSTFFTNDKSEIYMTGVMTSNNNKIILLAVLKPFLWLGKSKSKQL